MWKEAVVAYFGLLRCMYFDVTAYVVKFTKAKLDRRLEGPAVVASCKILYKIWPGNIEEMGEKTESLYPVNFISKCHAH
jgi:hypothetical protein